MTEVITLDAITHQVAAANIKAFADERRLEQGKWHGHGRDGREIACLLGAIHSGINEPAQCPAHLMPRWMARLTVRLFDGVARGLIFDYGRAYAERLQRWAAFDAAAWERVRRDFIAEVLGGVLKRAEGHSGALPPELWSAVKSVAERVLAVALAGDGVTRQWNALYAEARTARRAAWAHYHAVRRHAAVAAVAEVAAAAAVAAAAVAAAAAAEVAAPEAAAEAEAVAATSSQSPKMQFTNFNHKEK
jgi:hypothetical protein